MKAFSQLSEVNITTKEGVVLCAAIGMLQSCAEYAGKNPDEILVEVCKRAYPPDGEPKEFWGKGVIEDIIPLQKEPVKKPEIKDAVAKKTVKPEAKTGKEKKEK